MPIGSLIPVAQSLVRLPLQQVLFSGLCQRLGGSG
jgi:hypothetical protein